MKQLTALLLVFLLGGRPLAGSVAFGAEPPSSLVAVPFDSAPGQLFVDYEIWQNRDEVLQGLEHNLGFLHSERANQAYKLLEQTSFSREMVERSLERFKWVLLNSETLLELRVHLMHEFRLYRSVGVDGKGKVLFTGYYQPVYKASRTPTKDFRFPIFELPTDFPAWEKPHPTRISLEGYHGTGNPRSPLWGKELAWMQSRFEAFMVHVQGSAILELPDGSQMAVGYAGNTDYHFVGFNKRCLKKNVNGVSAREFFTSHPEELDECLAHNNRFIFFKENPNVAPIGNLGVPVIAERSIATDKQQLPPGAFGLIRTQMPYLAADGALRLVPASRIVLDQDAGGAIKGPGRVDVFMGTGHEAERKANQVYSGGELYYLVLKEQGSAQAGSTY